MTMIKTGDVFPAFPFRTHLRDDLNTPDVLKGKTVFWFLRYIGCTVCRLDVHLIASRYEEFKEKGAQVFVIMQSDRKHVLDDLAKSGTELPFEIVCDPEQSLYSLLEIRPAESMEALRGEGGDALKAKAAKARENGFAHGDYEGNEQQLPALFIVGEDGTVLYSHYAKELMDMPSVSDVIDML